MRARAKVEFGLLPTEALLPAAARLDEQPAAKIVDLLTAQEARTVQAVRGQRAAIAAAAELCAAALARGGRLVYAGAGTSGRLGALDAAECPPTFSVAPSRVCAVIAGGPRALTHAVEGAEDDPREAELRLRRVGLGPRDVLCAIAASGVTPFTLAALEYARRRRSRTIFVTCAKPPAAERLADVVIAAVVGPEVVAGSTRLKAGTATKLILNAISTTTFVLLGKTYGNLMVDVAPTSDKLRDRARRIVGALARLDERAAQALLTRAGGRPKVALVMHHRKVSRAKAEALLAEAGGRLRRVIGEVRRA
ncbi:MAG TPA: N-acetylmuramic acid 6-phosphate etherase [Polyangia bacterium]